MVGTSIALSWAVFASAKDILSKKVAFSLSGIASSWASFAFAVPFYLLCMLIGVVTNALTVSFSAEFLFLVTLRALSDAFFETSKMTALKIGELSQLVIAMQLIPIAMLFLSPLVTGDPLSSQIIVASVLAVAGCLVLFWHPSIKRPSRKFLLITFVCIISGAISSCLDRLAANQTSAVWSGFMMTLFAGIFVTPLMFMKRGSFSSIRGSLYECTLRGFFEIGYMVLKIWALQFMSAPQFMVMSRVNVLISLVGGNVLFREKGLVVKLIAALMIIVSGVVAVV